MTDMIERISDILLEDHIALMQENERLRAQNVRLAKRIGCGCGGDYGLCNECLEVLASTEPKKEES